MRNTRLERRGAKSVACLQDAASRLRSRPLVTQHHFDASRVLIPTVTFVATLVPLMVVAPKANVGLPPETAAGLLSDAGVVELLDGSLLQPIITMVADMTAMMIAFFIKRNQQRLLDIRRAGLFIASRFPLWAGTLKPSRGCSLILPPHHRSAARRLRSYDVAMLLHLMAAVARSGPVPAAPPHIPLFRGAQQICCSFVPAG